MTQRTAMLIDVPGVLADHAADGWTLRPGAAAVVQRMNLAQVPVLALRMVDSEAGMAEADVALSETVSAAGGRLAAVLSSAAPAGDVSRFPRPGLLLRAAQDHEVDLLTSWVISADTAAMQAAMQAGCVGGVLIGDTEEPTGLLGFTCNRAADLADAPRVMVPPQGGCWHDHGSA